jgi:hypothetical protein
LECFGCGGPHPWSYCTNGKWVVICLNAHQHFVTYRPCHIIRKF